MSTVSPESFSSGPRDGLDFQQVYDEFQPRIRRYVSRLIGAGEADDLTQEVFVRVSRALPEFRGESRLSTWVYRIASNAVVDRLRSPAFRDATRAAVLDQDALPADASLGAEQAAARAEMSGCIRRYVSDLPPAYRLVIVLSEAEGLTNPEIAEALGVSLETVKVRLHRARRRLRQALAAGCDLDRDERNELACEPKRAGAGVSSGDRPPSVGAERRSPP